MNTTEYFTNEEHFDDEGYREYERLEKFVKRSLLETFHEYIIRHKALALLATKNDVTGMREIVNGEHKDCVAIVVDAMVEQANEQGFEINRELAKQYVEERYSVGVELFVPRLYEQFGNELTFCNVSPYGQLYTKTGQLLYQGEGSIDILEADENGMILHCGKSDDCGTNIFRLTNEEAAAAVVEWEEYVDLQYLSLREFLEYRDRAFALGFDMYDYVDYAKKAGNLALKIDEYFEQRERAAKLGVEWSKYLEYREEAGASALKLDEWLKSSNKGNQDLEH